MTDSDFTRAIDDARKLIGNIEKVIVGKHDVVSITVAALLARGHVLLEDRPGLGKTILARALAKSVAGDFKRIQCTPDLLPVDITGYVDPRKDTFMPGAVFANIVLADEINRAMPRTQSALLEAMAESQVTVEGTTHQLPRPFMVIATQNPVEFRGVNDLPEAQLDRFIVMLTPGYPSEADERRILTERLQADPLDAIGPVIDGPRLRELIDAASRVRIDPRLIDYIIATVRATRSDDQLAMGASPRAALQLLGLARAYALIKGRSYVWPDDVKFLFRHGLAHRLVPRTVPDASVSASEWKVRIVDSLVQRIELPKLSPAE